MIQIPDKKKLETWAQPNTSDSIPTLWASKGIDLTSNEGKVRLGKKLLLNTDTADVSEITSYPAAFKVFRASKFAIAGASGTGYVFSSGTTYPSAGTFTKVTASNSPSAVDSKYSDMEISNGNLYVTQASNSVAWTTDGSTWSTQFAVGGSDTTSAHMLTSYAGRTYMSKLQSLILSWDSSNTVATSGQYTLQLGNSDSNVITFLRSSSNRIWIGVVNTLGGKGYVYEWDGSSTQVTKSYRLEAQGALSCVIKDDVPYVMDSNGSLLKWNGGTFTEIGRLNRRRNILLYNPLSTSNQRFIHPNGMSIVNGKININIDGRNYDNTSSQEETIPSGVWEYDPAHGLYHKESFGLTKSSSSTTDFGQFKIAGAGAISELNLPNNASNRNGTYLVGATYYTDATTTTSGIFYNDSNDTLQKGGYFDTYKIYSPNITETWQTFFYRFRKLLGSGDKIVVKYRTEEAEPTDITITWSTIGASTSTFTTTDANIANYAVGDEVEGIQGTGSGRCSHIVSISAPSGGTYTVVVDEVYTNATGTAKVRLQKWTKLYTASYGGTEVNFADIALKASATSTFIQFKVFMIFTGRGELDDLSLQTKSSQSAKS